MGAPIRGNTITIDSNLYLTTLSPFHFSVLIRSIALGATLFQLKLVYFVVVFRSQGNINNILSHKNKLMKTLTRRKVLSKKKTNSFKLQVKLKEFAYYLPQTDSNMLNLIALKLIYGSYISY